MTLGLDDPFRHKLAALQFPERRLVFDDGQKEECSELMMEHGE